jgi:bacterioferritin
VLKYRRTKEYQKRFKGINMSLEYMQGIQQQVDNNEIIKQLRRALADEYLTAHQYWTQSKIIQGVYKDEINKELYQHRDEEMGHANMLMDRILQLGGNPEIRPLDWDSLASCRYQLANDWDQKTILNQAIQGERCAVDHYTSIAQFTQSRDTTTYDIIMNILDDEYEHIRDLSKLQEMLQTGNKKKG